jgi:hypothetical protein
MSYGTCVTRVTIGLEEISPKMHSNLFRACATAPVTDTYVLVALLLALLVLIADKLFNLLPFYFLLGISRYTPLSEHSGLGFGADLAVSEKLK